MFLGIPRGLFYYDYYLFIRRIFEDSEIEIIDGPENTDYILSIGNEVTVDEACLPVKLTAGQINILSKTCDFVLVPRLMKDINGRWFCPKVLGLPELISRNLSKEKMLVTEPIYLNKKRMAADVFRKISRTLGVSDKIFNKNFDSAYNELVSISKGIQNMHIEVDWEFIPQLAKTGEIILPNTRKVFLAGHCYNVYDKFANNNIMKRLDELCIGTITERDVSYSDKDEAVSKLNLIKKPFWESVIRSVGTAICLKEKVDGIIYLSSFSCGPDALIIELIKEYVPDLPMMVIKLDEHRGSAGFETRLEAFSDLLERRRTS